MKPIPPLSHDERFRAVLGQRIRGFRRQKRLTQEALAKAIGCSAHTVLRYENGEILPSLPRLLRLREVLGVTLDYLVTGLVPAAENVRDPNLLARFQQLQHLTPERRKRILHVIASLLRRPEAEGPSGPLRAV